MNSNTKYLIAAVTSISVVTLLFAQTNTQKRGEVTSTALSRQLLLQETPVQMQNVMQIQGGLASNVINIAAGSNVFIITNGSGQLVTVSATKSIGVGAGTNIVAVTNADGTITIHSTATGSGGTNTGPIYSSNIVDRVGLQFAGAGVTTNLQGSTNLLVTIPGQQGFTFANVVNLGADNTGVADSTTAFVVGQTNPVLYVPAGTYSVTNITFTNNIIVFGDGPASLIKQPLSATGAIFTTTAGKFANFRDLALSGGITTNSLYDPGIFYSHGTLGTKHGMALNCSGYPRVENVYLFNFNGYGIDISGGGDIYYRTNFYTVQRCFFTNNFTAIHCGDNNTSEYGQIHGNFFMRNYHHLDIQGANVQVTGNEGHDAQFSLYIHPFLNGRSHCLISGNIFHHSTYQFQIENATTGLEIIGNSFMAGLGTPGVSTNGGTWMIGYINPSCNGVQIRDNQFENNICLGDFSTGTNIIKGNHWFSDGAAAFVPGSGTFGINSGKFGFTNCVDSDNWLMDSGPVWLNPTPTVYLPGTNSIVWLDSRGRLVPTNGVSIIFASGFTMSTQSVGGLTYIYVTNTASGGGSATNLTPWTTDIDAAGYSLTNLLKLTTKSVLLTTNAASSTIIDMEGGDAQWLDVSADTVFTGLTNSATKNYKEIQIFLTNTTAANKTISILPISIQTSDGATNWTLGAGQGTNAILRVKNYPGRLTNATFTAYWNTNAGATVTTNVPYFLYVGDSLAPGVGGNTNQWIDTSGNGFLLSGTSPLIQTSASINNHDYVHLNNTYLRNAAITNAASNPFEIVVVARWWSSGQTDGAHFLFDSYNSSNRYNFIINGTVSTTNWFQAGVNGTSVTGSYAATNKWMVFNIYFDGAGNGTILTNMDTYATGTVGLTNYGGICLGMRFDTTTNPGYWDIAEMRGYTNLLGANRLAVWQYLTNKYQFTYP